MKTALKSFEPVNTDSSDTEIEENKAEGLDNSDFENMMNEFDSFLQT